MKIYMETLGCPKNFNDTQTAKGIMTKAGFEVTEDADLADVIIVNTCGFINDAKKNPFQGYLNSLNIREIGRNY